MTLNSFGAKIRTTPNVMRYRKLIPLYLSKFAITVFYSFRGGDFFDESMSIDTSLTPSTNV